MTTKIFQQKPTAYLLALCSLCLFSFFSFLPFALASSMVTVAGGSFTPLYGSLKEPVVVASLQVDVNPVTNREYLQFLRQHPEWQKNKAKTIFVDQSYLMHWESTLSPGKKAPLEAPVVYVSWFAANAYCQSLNKRLPTVNEWEYIASRPIPNKDITRVILDWYSVPTPEVMPSVKTGLKNSSGVSNMHGLIWEWTLDFNSALVTGESRADDSLDKTLFCGGGSAGAADKTDYAAFMRFAFRSSLKAKYTVGNLGFRCVTDLKE